MSLDSYSPSVQVVLRRARHQCAEAGAEQVSLMHLEKALLHLTGPRPHLAELEDTDTWVSYVNKDSGERLVVREGTPEWETFLMTKHA